MTTIFAIATGASRGAVAIVRISGPDTKSILTRLAGRVPAPRRASLRTLRAADGEALDRGVVLWFPGPGSYTGEDSGELQVHGGRAVLTAVSDALLAAGARAAEPGEFTRRAFLNGRMDLLEAEGVADLIAAVTPTQRRQALAQVEGAQSVVLSRWAAQLQRMLAWQEALIDFPEDDLPDEVEAELANDTARLAAELSQAAASTAHGTRVRDGVVVAITGAPNVGKSSLINALSGREIAITSDQPGTTRDTLEVWIELAGVPVVLVDTAGLRETDDPVEAEGVRRARARATDADIVMHVAEAGEDAIDAGDLMVANKVDLRAASPGWLGVSARTGEGLPQFRQQLEAEVRRLTDAGPHPVLNRAWHRTALEEARACLDRATMVSVAELRGEELRLAMRALGRITGAVDVEDILDTVFSAFCIGK